MRIWHSKLIGGIFPIKKGHSESNFYLLPHDIMTPRTDAAHPIYAIIDHDNSFYPHNLSLAVPKISLALDHKYVQNSIVVCMCNFNANVTLGRCQLNSYFRLANVEPERE